MEVSVDGHILILLRKVRFYGNFFGVNCQDWMSPEVVSRYQRYDTEVRE